MAEKVVFPNAYKGVPHHGPSLLSDPRVQKVGESGPGQTRCLPVGHGQHRPRDGNHHHGLGLRRMVIGSNGAVTRVAEFIPGVNNGIQFCHKIRGKREALERAKRHDPMGADGVITRLGEHIPVINDGIMALHLRAGKCAQADRVRARTVQGLLSKDGTVTKLFEAVPGLNLVAAAVHEVKGHSEEAHRALALLENWKELGDKDGALAKLAELIPGTDVVAFAAHLNNGSYAQALRSVVKMPWLEISIETLRVEATVASAKELALNVLDVEGVVLNPKQTSMLGALVDVALHALGVSARQDGLRGNVADTIKVAVNDAISEQMKNLLYVLETAVHDGVRQLNDLLVQQHLRYHSSDWWNVKEWMISWFLGTLPEHVRPPSAALVVAVHEAIMNTEVRHELLPETESIRPRNHLRGVPETAGVVSCFSFLGCLGFHSSALCGLSCLAGCTAGAIFGGRCGLGFLRDFNRQSQLAFRGGGPPLLEPYARLHGPVVEIDENNLINLTTGVRQYLLDDLLGQCRFWRWVLTAAFKFLRHMVVGQGMQTRVGLPLAVNIEVPEGQGCSRRDGGPMDLSLPQLNILLLLEIGFDSEGPVVRSAHVALRDDLINEILESVTTQLTEQDLRTLDPSLAGFAQPFKINLKPRLTWPFKSRLRLDVEKAYVKMFLPE